MCIRTFASIVYPSCGLSDSLIFDCQWFFSAVAQHFDTSMESHAASAAEFVCLVEMERFISPWKLIMPMSTLELPSSSDLEPQREVELRIFDTAKVSTEALANSSAERR